MFRNDFKFHLFFILFLGIFIVSLPLINIEAANTQINNPLNANSFTELFFTIADWVAGIAVSVAVLMVIIGGIQYMVSGGNEEKTKSALKTIKWALVGLGIILASWSLLSVLLGLLGIS